MATTEQDYLPALLAQLQQTGGGPAALDLLARAAGDHAMDPRPLVLLAAEQMHLGQVDRAEAAYILALQRAPAFAIARFQLGLLQFTSARPAAATATWAPLEALGEKDPLCLFKRGLEAMGLNRFEEARSLLLAGMAANRSNEPLNRDMQMVIDRLVENGLLQATPTGGGSAGGATHPVPEGQEHFLVSSYGRKG
jgi:Flp pilus assembly protein TadD